MYLTRNLTSRFFFLMTVYRVLSRCQSDGLLMKDLILQRNMKAMGKV